MCIRDRLYSYWFLFQSFLKTGFWWLSNLCFHILTDFFLSLISSVLHGFGSLATLFVRILQWFSAASWSILLKLDRPFVSIIAFQVFGMFFRSRSAFSSTSFMYPSLSRLSVSSICSTCKPCREFLVDDVCLLANHRVAN